MATKRTPHYGKNLSSSSMDPFDLCRFASWKTLIDASPGLGLVELVLNKLKVIITILNRESRATTTSTTDTANSYVYWIYSNLDIVRVSGENLDKVIGGLVEPRNRLKAMQAHCVVNEEDVKGAVTRMGIPFRGCGKGKGNRWTRTTALTGERATKLIKLITVLAEGEISMIGLQGLEPDVAEYIEDRVHTAARRRAALHPAYMKPFQLDEQGISRTSFTETLKTKCNVTERNLEGYLDIYACVAALVNRGRIHESFLFGLCPVHRLCTTRVDKIAHVHTLEGRLLRKRDKQTQTEKDCAESGDLETWKESHLFDVHECGICGATFVHVDMALQHMERQHANDYRCEFDGYETKNESFMDSHLFTFHRELLEDKKRQAIQPFAKGVSRENVIGYLRDFKYEELTADGKETARENMEKLCTDDDIVYGFCAYKENLILRNVLHTNTHYKKKRKDARKAAKECLASNEQARRAAQAAGKPCPPKPISLKPFRKSYGQRPKDFWSWDRLTLDIERSVASQTEAMATPARGKRSNAQLDIENTPLTSSKKRTKKENHRAADCKRSLFGTARENRI